ncbi:hypothetical protein HPB50_004121 [Hyalomma asiaticum]|uniref:Uncharacterized protein n=1 Tax=Hyalomma asiaticum TaxID=266040 RepID=A0ACB7SBL1_HYAAI|nr:hypothetical protein HPB50_004121 [Hyalomma asiaticum]
MPRTYVAGDTTVIIHQENKSRLTEIADKLPRGIKVDGGRTLETQLATSTAAPDLTAICCPTEGRGRKGLKLYQSLVPCWAGSLCVGTALGYALPAGRTLDAAAHRGVLEITQKQILWFGSMMSLGAVFGSLAGALVTQLSGRRWSLSIAAMGLVASWLVIGFSRIMYYCCGARFFCGFLTGVVSVVVPSHIAEMAPVSQRGMYVSLAVDEYTVEGAAHQFAVTLGILNAYFLGRFLDWDWLALSCATPAVVLMLVTRAFALESPRWILQKGDSLGALNALTAVRGSKSQADIEFDAIQAVLPKYRTPVAHYLLALLLMVTQQLSGVNSVIISTVSLDPGLDLSAPSTDSVILLALLQAVTTLVFVPFVDSLGRRKLLALSVALCWGSISYLGVVYYTSGPNRPLVIEVSTETPPDYGEVGATTPNVASDVDNTVPLVLKALFVFGFSIGLGPVPWILAAELVPLRGTGLEFGSVCAANWAGSFVTANFVAITSNTRMLAVSLWLYGIIALTGGLISFALLPDTDRMSIEDILLIDPDERARRRKIVSKSIEKLPAPPGSGGNGSRNDTLAPVVQPQMSLSKSLARDMSSVGAAQPPMTCLAADKLESSLSHTPTELLTTEKRESDASQSPPKDSDNKAAAVSKRQPPDTDSRKSSIASQKSTSSKGSAASRRSGDGTRKKAGTE